MAGRGLQKLSKDSDKLQAQKMNLTPVIIKKIHNQSHLRLSPQVVGDGSPKPITARWSCLCSPTTHAGSFRCRFHRNPDIPRGGSIGSNLSQLVTEPGRISESLQAQ